MGSYPGLLRLNEPQGASVRDRWWDMFTCFADAPAARGGALRALRLSLNTPVVSIDELPVGPAAAGIAVHQREGRLELVLALRSVRTGQRVYFRLEEGDRDAAHASLAVEVAVQFAEAMGFLFDEDLVRGGADLRDAARCWNRFLAEPAPEERGSAAAAEPSRPPAGLLSKFRFAEPGASAPAARDWRHDDVWVRLLGRY